VGESHEELDNRIPVGRRGAAMLYGIILHLDAQEATEHQAKFGEADYFFVSVNAESYYEVNGFPRISTEEEASAHEAQIAEWQDPPLNENGSRTLRMSFARRFFSQEEQRPDRHVTFDGRLWPPVTEKPDGSKPAHIEAGLPAEVTYAGLGTRKARAV
jgi:hypothetical protein